MWRLPRRVKAPPLTERRFATCPPQQLLFPTSPGPAIRHALQPDGEGKAAGLGGLLETGKETRALWGAVGFLKNVIYTHTQ